jgi:fructokinase
VTDLYGGVETGGTWCVCAIGTGPEAVVRREEFPTTDPEETLARIVAFFERGPAVRAVGVGAFGPLDLDPDSPRWGHVTSTPKPGWRNVPIGPAIRDALGVPVRVETDVGAAALAEHRWGAGRGVGSLCYLTVGTGIGGGLLVGGRPLHGLVHPEVGHIRIPHDRARDPYPGHCPSHGDCWEGLAAGPALAARWNASPDTLAAEHPAWELEADYLASGILCIVMIASPERVVLGGGVMQRTGLLERVRERLRELVAGYLETPLLDDEIDTYLVAPELGDAAGVLGAIALADSGAGR